MTELDNLLRKITDLMAIMIRVVNNSKMDYAYVFM